MANSNFEKIVLVTRKTRLDELKIRFHSMLQAKFYLERAGIDIQPYLSEDHCYQEALREIQQQISSFGDLKFQQIDRSYVSRFLFSSRDLVLVLGQDGTVANTAKYATNIPIIGINPDPDRIDGMLLPFVASQLSGALKTVLKGSGLIRELSLALLETSDGQKLHAFNDFFIGCRGHTSFRYRIEQSGKSENQSSSGIIISTGVGSTGSLSSFLHAVNGYSKAFGAPPLVLPKMHWESENLIFAVREPFVSKSSSAENVWGTVSAHAPLTIESAVAQDGVIFSDGMEADFLAFNSGNIAKIGIAPEKARLVCAK